jgi:hypothetical protein
MHGGKSRGGIASPRLVHGWYSTYLPYTFMRATVYAYERRQRFMEARRQRLEADRLVRKS